jgi:hypothetical protein
MRFHRGEQMRKLRTIVSAVVKRRPIDSFELTPAPADAPREAHQR